MAIGMFYGRNSSAQPMETSYLLVQRMLGEFTNKFGSTNCRELTGGLDFNKEEDLKKFLQGGSSHRCRHFTEVAAGITMSLIMESSLVSL